MITPTQASLQMDVEGILCFPGSGQRFHRSGIDSLQLVQRHVAAAWEDPAARTDSGALRPESRDQLLQLLEMLYRESTVR